MTPTEPPITPTSPLVTHNLYIYGYPDGTFGPERNITREEVAAMLSRVLEYELSTPTADPFDDVSADRWSAANIAAAKEQGIMQGDGTGAFGPSKLMTRAELATVLVRIVQSQDRQFTGEEITFSDVNASAWYAEYIALAAKYGLITDYPDSTFRPDNTVTRVEAVIMINHMLDRDPETAEELKTMDFPFSDMSKSDSAYLHVMEATITHRH